MTDAPPNSASRTGVAAIVTYVLLGIFALALLGVFLLISYGVKIDGVTLGVLGGALGTLQTMLVGAVGFWIGSSVGAKASGDALAQLAGAGPPPPSQPLADEGGK
jgi:hypothetical protein